MAIFAAGALGAGDSWPGGVCGARTVSCKGAEGGPMN